MNIFILLETFHRQQLVTSVIALETVFIILIKWQRGSFHADSDLSRNALADA